MNLFILLTISYKKETLPTELNSNLSYFEEVTLKLKFVVKVYALSQVYDREGN